MGQRRTSEHWLALVVGNSRWHWAWFYGGTFVRVWDSDRLSRPVVGGKIAPEWLPAGLRAIAPSSLPVCLASVVAEQTILWQNYAPLEVLSLAQVPLAKLYPTLGIDRALAVWGAGNTWGFPVLVIDAGTALTLTGADGDRALVGGAILPGFRLQFHALASGTSALPEIRLTEQLPSRWPNNTQEAIASGVTFSILAGARDFLIEWRSRFPHSSVVLTGGDAAVLHGYFRQVDAAIASQFVLDPLATFRGMRLVRSAGKSQPDSVTPFPERL